MGLCCGWKSQGGVTVEDEEGSTWLLKALLSKNTISGSPLVPVLVLGLWSEETPILWAKDRINGSPRDTHLLGPQHLWSSPSLRHVLGPHKVLPSRTWAMVGKIVSFYIPLSPLRKDLSKDFLRQEWQWGNPTWFLTVSCCSNTLWKARVVSKTSRQNNLQITDDKYSFINTKQQKPS